VQRIHLLKGCSDGILAVHLSMRRVPLM
jgi:hypothetical protein